MCIRSVILGELENYIILTRNWKGFIQYYFPENFRCNLLYCESKNFAYSFFRHMFEFENFSLPFFYEKYNLLWS